MIILEKTVSIINDENDWEFKTTESSQTDFDSLYEIRKEKINYTDDLDVDYLIDNIINAKIYINKSELQKAVSNNIIQIKINLRYIDLSKLNDEHTRKEEKTLDEFNNYCCCVEYDIDYISGYTVEIEYYGNIYNPCNYNDYICYLDDYNDYERSEYSFGDRVKFKNKIHGCEYGIIICDNENNTYDIAINYNNGILLLHDGNEVHYSNIDKLICKEIKLAKAIFKDCDFTYTEEYQQYVNNINTPL